MSAGIDIDIHSCFAEGGKISFKLHALREAFKKKYREKSENGLLGGWVSHLFHFFELL